MLIFLSALTKSFNLELHFDILKRFD